MIGSAQAGIDLYMEAVPLQDSLTPKQKYPTPPWLLEMWSCDVKIMLCFFEHLTSFILPRWKSWLWSPQLVWMVIVSAHIFTPWDSNSFFWKLCILFFIFVYFYEKRNACHYKKSDTAKMNKAKITTVNILLIIPHFYLYTYSHTYPLQKWGASSPTL